MKLTLDQVKHVAKLANLPLFSEEEEKYGEQLSKILDYIEQLNQVDTFKVESTFNVTGLDSVLRDDEPQAGLLQEKVLANASKKKDSMFETNSGARLGMTEMVGYE